MLCQLSYRGRQPPDCSRGLRCSTCGEDGARGPRTCRHASLRRRRRRGVHWRPRVRSLRGSRPVHASPRSRSALRAHGFDPGPVDGVRGPLTTDRARRVPAPERACGRPGGSAVRRGARSASRGRPLLGQRELGGRSGRLGRRGARVPAAPLRASGAARSTAGSRARPPPRSAGSSVGTRSTPTASPARARTARSRAARRRSGTSSHRERASSRSRRATTSARGGSPGVTGSR